MDTIDKLKAKYEPLARYLDDTGRRLWAAIEARSMGRGGVTTLAKVTGLSRTTVQQGLSDLGAIEAGRGPKLPQDRVNTAGRPRLVDSDPKLLVELDKLLEPTKRGTQNPPLRWSTKGAAQLSKELEERGCHISQPALGSLLKRLGYQLHPTYQVHAVGVQLDRSAQLKHLAFTAQEHIRNGQPAVWMDVRRQTNEEVDSSRSKVRVGPDNASLTVQALRCWWSEFGSLVFTSAKALLLILDVGDTSARAMRPWLGALQRFADEQGLTVRVCSAPPATTRWEQVDHHMEIRIGSVDHDKSITGHVINMRTLGIAGQPPLQAPRPMPTTDLAHSVIHDTFHSEWNLEIHPRRKI